MQDMAVLVVIPLVSLDSKLPESRVPALLLTRALILLVFSM